MTDTPQSAAGHPGPDTPAATAAPSVLRTFLGTQLGCKLWEFLTMFAVTAFFLLYGLAPLTGGDQLGLVGADEPRYAQIAREMLQAHDQLCGQLHATMLPHTPLPRDIHASYRCALSGTITPILHGKPWLEKPALYYWRAMGFYREFGVSDWSARLPSTSGAALLILLAFLHLRRFRPGGHLDAALIMVSTAAIVGFARGASTDMQLAAPFCIGMLGWYAWYETGKKFWLFDLYFFGAAATLAKGPVAPFLALGIICLFLGLRREWSALRRTIWLPGVVLYLVMVLPWYIAVQRRNPTFFNEFFVNHNLKRFGTNLYEHHQPAYYYLVVLVVGLMPWTALTLRALWDGLQISIAEWKTRFKPQRYLGHVRPGDAFPEFLVLWTLFPIVFFSFSGSKLPGYILPSLPPVAILTGDYLYRTRRAGISDALLNLHASLTGIITFVLLLCPQYMRYERIVPAPFALLRAGLLGILAAVSVIFVVRRWGVVHLRTATLLPLVGLMVFLLGMNGHLLDLNYSARPLAREIQVNAPDATTVAVVDMTGPMGVKRDLVYGLAFYRNQRIVNYTLDGLPAGPHVLILPTHEASQLDTLLRGRVYQPLFLYETKGLSVYKVFAAK